MFCRDYLTGIEERVSQYQLEGYYNSWVKGNEGVEHERRVLSYYVGGIDVTWHINMGDVPIISPEMSQIIQNFLAWRTGRLEMF